MTVIVTLKPMPGNWRAPVDVRLRHFLKAAKRQWGLQCVMLREERSEMTQDAPDHINTPPANRNPSGS